MNSRNCTYVVKDIFVRRSLPLLLASRSNLNIRPCEEFTVQQIRQLSEKAFNLSDIIKANAKHKPGKSVGTATQKQLNKSSTVKAKKTDTVEESDTHKSKKKSEDKLSTSKTTKTESGLDKPHEVKRKSRSAKFRRADGSDKDRTETEDSPRPIPAHLKSILEIPLILNKDLHTKKLAEFKEFVEDLDLKYLPSVSTIINSTQTPEQVKVLERWKANKTKELGGEEQFNQYKKDLLDNGLNLHECIYNQLSGHPGTTPLRQGNEGHWESITKVLPDVSEVFLMEKDCLHPELFYRGKFDCVARYRGALCLIEWKTSAKPKPLLGDTYDNPLQIAAYLGAINRSNMLKKQGVEQLTSGAIVIAYTDGEPATVHTMNERQCDRYWKLWLKRLYTYWVTKYDSKI